MEGRRVGKYRVDSKKLLHFLGLPELNIIHAEMNAILSAKQDLSGCVMYVTGMPCKSCFLHILGSGIGGVVFGDISYKECESDQIIKAHLYSLYNLELWLYDKNKGQKTKFWFHEDLRG